MEKIFSSIIGNPFFTLDEHLSKTVNNKRVEEILINESSDLFDQKMLSLKKNSNAKIISVCGIPASGKTYYSNEIIKINNEKYFYISFDDIMESFSLYIELLKKNKELAFETFEIPARIIGYQWLKKCIENRIPILFDNSNTMQQHIAIYQIMKDVYDYYIEIHFLNISPSVTIPRMARRERFFPEEQVYSRWDKIKSLLPAYKVIANKFVIIESQQ